MIGFDQQEKNLGSEQTCRMPWVREVSSGMSTTPAKRLISRTLPPKKYSFATQPQRLNFTGVLEPKPTAREIGAAGSACIFRPALLASSASVFFFLSVICKKQRQCRCGMHNPTQECTVCAERVCMVQMLSMQTVCCMLHDSMLGHEQLRMWHGKG